jgi:hypothetical protein
LPAATDATGGSARRDSTAGRWSVTATRSSRWRAPVGAVRVPCWGARDDDSWRPFGVPPNMHVRHRPVAGSGTRRRRRLLTRSRRLTLAACHLPAAGRWHDPGNADRQLLEVAAWWVCRDVVSTRTVVRSTPRGCSGGGRVEHDCHEVSEVVATGPWIGGAMSVSPRHLQISVSVGLSGSESASVQRA